MQWWFPDSPVSAVMDLKMQWQFLHTPVSAVVDLWMQATVVLKYRAAYGVTRETVAVPACS